MKLFRDTSADRKVQKREAGNDHRLRDWTPSPLEPTHAPAVNVSDALVQLKLRRGLIDAPATTPDLTDGLEPLRVQRAVQLAGRELSGDTIQQAAAAGVQTPSTSLPHLDQLQPLFGHHDLSGVKAHVGEEATQSARAAGALAFATGNDVVFAGTPDLHTAAHEAAHVVQQRGGVHLAGGVGREGDEYERHADAVADRVVSGESAEALLDRYAGGRDGASSAAAGTERSERGGPIQRMVSVGGQAVDAVPEQVQGNAIQVIQGWIADGDLDLEFQDWNEAIAVAAGGNAALEAHKAVQWLRGQGWNVPRADIVDPALTAGNCHGLTFGAGGAAFISFDSIQQLVDDWNALGQPAIMVCLEGDLVAHTATLDGGRWRQTLPGGPVFLTDAALLAAKYQCFQLPGQLNGLQAMATQQLDDYQALLDEARALFEPASQVPAEERTNDQHDLANWFAALADMEEFSDENRTLLQNRIDMAHDMA